MCCFRVDGSFVCASTLVLRMIVCAFAVVFCTVAFYILRVRRLHVCFGFRAFGLFARVCLVCV